MNIFINKFLYVGRFLAIMSIWSQLVHEKLYEVLISKKREKTSVFAHSLK